MAEKEDEGKIISLSGQVQKLEKIVICPGCGGKIKVEFEIDLEMVMPTPDILKKLDEKHTEKKVE